jgi:hypothetical protein
MNPEAPVSEEHKTTTLAGNRAFLSPYTYYQPRTNPLVHARAHFRSSTWPIRIRRRDARAYRQRLVRKGYLVDPRFR